VGEDGESEDIVQEAFLKVYHNLKTFKRNARFSTWLYRIVVNTAYDFLRRRKNFVSDEFALDNAVSAGELPGDALLKREREAMIRKALEAVPLKFRAALVLKEIEGLSYIEISRVLGCGLGTVESKIYRARQYLKDELLKLPGGSI
jgi:RNA polymerase sigma-70 factor (ECF subfamily)